MRFSRLVLATWVGAIAACQGEPLETVTAEISAPPSCNHGVCATGGPLAATCNGCASAVCQRDPYCCTIAWDSQCVAESNADCANVCATTCPVPQAPAVVAYASWNRRLPAPAGSHLDIVLGPAGQSQVNAFVYDPASDRMVLIVRMSRQQLASFFGDTLSSPVPTIFYKPYGVDCLPGIDGCPPEPPWQAALADARSSGLDLEDVGAAECQPPFSM
jgi:hypothetical protein